MTKKVENSNNAYKQDKLGKIPSWIKVILLKYWVAGATFYFFGMGGYFLWANGRDDNAITLLLFAVIGFGYTLFKEYIEKHVIRLMRTTSDDTYRYNMINLHGAKSFLAHLVYCYFLTLLMMIITVNMFTYENIWDVGSNGMEPFGVALIYLVLDVVCIVIKNLIIGLVKHIKYKKQLKLQQSLLSEDDVVLYGDDNSLNNVDNFLNDEENKGE